MFDHRDDNRVGGGIYTKAADMGADLVGKTEAHIPEDDPRNPATIADNVGDNVGDVAGLGSDLLESYVGAIMSAVILAIEVFRNSLTFTDESLLRGMMLFPIAFAGVGILACVIGIASLLMKKKLSENPHRELNMSTWIAAGTTIVFGGLLTYFCFSGADAAVLKSAGFGAGFLSPWYSAAIGVAAGIIIGVIAEYYTSYDYKPTKKIAEASVEGSRSPSRRAWRSACAPAWRRSSCSASPFTAPTSFAVCTASASPPSACCPSCPQPSRSIHTARSRITPAASPR